jgi:hypothetical protein
MNMSFTQNAHTNQKLDIFIGAEVVAINAQASQDVNGGLAAAKQFLDRHFPLAKGSHAQVASYLVYYTHLLAFMTDGSQTGLAVPQQFVALSGHKSDPSSIVLKEGNTHLALTFDRQGELGRHDCADIENILLKIQGSRTETSVDIWTSLLNHPMNPAQLSFTAKDGSDYPLA